MEYCIWDYCLSGYELILFAVLEIGFWFFMGIFAYKKFKNRK